MAAELGRPRIAERIVDVLVPLVMDEIIEVFRRISHKRIQQRIVEEIVEEVPEADQGQSTLERQDKDSRADTIWTGVSEQPAFESSPAGNKPDLSEDEKSLAAVLASVAASKNN